MLAFVFALFVLNSITLLFDVFDASTLRNSTAAVSAVLVIRFR